MSAGRGNPGFAGRPAAWIVLVVAAALSVGYLFRPEGRRSGNVLRSSFRTTPDGVAALARGIGRLGRPAGKRITPMAGADPVRGTVVVLEPPLFPSPREVRALLDRVRAGGTLLYAPKYRANRFGRVGATPLMDSLGVALRERSAREEASDELLLRPRWHEHALTAGLPAPLPPVLDRVRAGGTLLYAPKYRANRFGRVGATPLMDSLGVALRERSAREEASDELLLRPRWHEHALTAGLPAPLPPVHGLRVRGDADPDSSGVDGVERLLTAEDGEGVEWIAAAELSLGEGRVVVFSEAAPLSNERAGDDPLAVLAVRAALAYTGAADTVFFDEFHQGIRGERSRAEVLGDFFLGSRGGMTLLHLAAACLLVLACAGIRFGAPAPAVAPPDLERRSPLEHVSALGDLYRKAGAPNTAALLLLARLARSARRPPPRTAGEAVALLRKLDAGEGPDTPLARARKGLRAIPPDLAAIVAGVDEHLAARGSRSRRRPTRRLGP